MIINQIDPDILKTRTYLGVDTESGHLKLLADLEEMIARRISPQQVSGKYNRYIDKLKEEELIAFAIDVQRYLEERGAFNRRRTPKEQRIYEALNEARNRSRSRGTGKKR